METFFCKGCMKTKSISLLGSVMKSGRKSCKACDAIARENIAKAQKPK